MNEKIGIVFIVSLLLFSLSGCCTGAGIRDNGSGAYEVRENLGKLGDEQTQSAVTSTELKGEIDRSIDEVGSLAKSITSGERDLEEFKAILRRIRERGKYGTGAKNEAD